MNTKERLVNELRTLLAQAERSALQSGFRKDSGPFYSYITGYLSTGIELVAADLEKM